MIRVGNAPFDVQTYVKLKFRKRLNSFCSETAFSARLPKSKYSVDTLLLSSRMLSTLIWYTLYFSIPFCVELESVSVPMKYSRYFNSFELRFLVKRCYRELSGLVPPPSGETVDVV